MMERTVVCILLLMVLIIADGKRFRHYELRAKTLYGVVLVAVLYAMALFVTRLPGPNVTDVFELVYGWPAKQLNLILDTKP